jgi:hypothetical protein
MGTSLLLSRELTPPIEENEYEDVKNAGGWSQA